MLKSLTYTDREGVTIELPLSVATSGGHTMDDRACEHCKESPLTIAGRGMEIEGDGWSDTYVAQACCKSCMGSVGKIRAKMGTIFGLREDAAVLHSRCRVY
jgi:hypothetical protein